MGGFGILTCCPGRPSGGAGRITSADLTRVSSSVQREIEVCGDGDRETLSEARGGHLGLNLSGTCGGPGLPVQRLCPVGQLRTNVASPV